MALLSKQKTCLPHFSEFPRLLIQPDSLRERKMLIQDRETHIPGTHSNLNTHTIWTTGYMTVSGGGYGGKWITQHTTIQHNQRSCFGPFHRVARQRLSQLFFCHLKIIYWNHPVNSFSSKQHDILIFQCDITLHAKEKNVMFYYFNQYYSA